MNDTPRPRTFDEEIIEADRRDVASLLSDSERLERIVREIETGFQAMADVERGVAVWGSARTLPRDPWYGVARELGRELGHRGYSVLTGGGPGIMEAANRGASEAGALSIGLNIELPFEQEMNPWVERGIQFRYFFARKLMFVRYSVAWVIFPGGFGTLDELFEVLTLIQTGKVRHAPVVLAGREEWEGMLRWLHEVTLPAGRIASTDLDLLYVCDTPREIAEHVDAAAAC